MPYLDEFSMNFFLRFFVCSLWVFVYVICVCVWTKHIALSEIVWSRRMVHLFTFHHSTTSLQFISLSNRRAEAKKTPFHRLYEKRMGLWSMKVIFFFLRVQTMSRAKGEIWKCQNFLWKIRIQFLESMDMPEICDNVVYDKMDKKCTTPLCVCVCMHEVM